MHIETSTDARLSKQRTAGGSHDGGSASGRGIFATIASAFQSVVGSASRPSAPTADADTGAGLRGSNDVGRRSADGDAATAPSEADYTPQPSDLYYV